MAVEYICDNCNKREPASDRNGTYEHPIEWLERRKDGDKTYQHICSEVCKIALDANVTHSKAGDATKYDLYKIVAAAKALIDALPDCEECGEKAMYGHMESGGPGFCDEPGDPSVFTVLCANHRDGHKDLDYGPALRVLLAALLGMPAGWLGMELDELERLESEATSRPWHFDKGNPFGHGYGYVGNDTVNDRDSALIVAARNALPMLLADSRALSVLRTRCQIAENGRESAEASAFVAWSNVQTLSVRGSKLERLAIMEIERIMAARAIRGGGA